VIENHFRTIGHGNALHSLSASSALLQEARPNTPARGRELLTVRGQLLLGQRWLHTAAVAAERCDFTRNSANMGARPSRGDPARYRAAEEEGRADLHQPGETDLGQTAGGD
jgi:hypothetical protein